MTLTPRLGITQLEQSQSQKEAIVNGGVAVLEMFATRLIVKSQGDNSPPGSPAEGDAYLIGSTATGGWTGHDDELALRINGAWEYLTPKEGFEIEVEDEDASYVYRGGTWVGGGGGALDDLSDVNAPTPSDGDVLTWDDTPGEWVAAAPGGGPGGSGTSYEAGPITEPSTASLATWVNQGTSTVADGVDALILRPQPTGVVRGREMTAPSAPYDLYCRLDMVAMTDAAVTVQIDNVAGIILRDNSDGELIILGAYFQRISGDEQNLYGVAFQRWTSSGATFSANIALFYTPEMPKWLRVNVTSTTITPYISQDGKNWTQLPGITETIASFIDTVDRIGFGGASDADNDATEFLCSYFSTTAPS